MAGPLGRGAEGGEAGGGATAVTVARLGDGGDLSAGAHVASAAAFRRRRDRGPRGEQPRVAKLVLEWLGARPWRSALAFAMEDGAEQGKGWGERERKRCVPSAKL